VEARHVARPRTPNAANATMMAGALAHEFFTPPDPAFAITKFDFDRDPARMEAFSAVFDTYRIRTLAAFRRRGGKLLIFHGTADPDLLRARVDRLLPASDPQ
jgi:feruloyl esterase